MNIFQKLHKKSSLFLLTFLIYPILVFFILPKPQHFIVHITTSCILSSILLGMIKNKILRNILSAIIFLIIGCQIAHITQTGYYIMEMTLININETSSLSNYTMIKIILTVLAFTIYGIFHINYINKLKLHINKYITTLLLISFFIGSKNPIISFSSTIYNFGYNIIRFSYDEQEHIRQKDLYRKDYIYTNNKTNVPNIKGKNVITIFTEGFSLNIIDSFNNQYKDLTPNLDKFAKQSLHFNNYYNHTAATYNGIRGQLTSSYQMVAGVISKETNKKVFYNTIIDLPHILRKNGYHTYFLSTHDNNSPLNNMLETMDFDKVYGADDYKKGSTSLTDQELFEYLYTLIKSKKLKEPYFIGLYNLGTHVGMDSPDVKYTIKGKNDNALLNVFHNYDNAFGKFFIKIKSGKEANNTAIIQTADHATLWANVNNMFKGFNNNAIGKVPFFLWYKDIKPQTIDVKNKNSLDFAPTLLNMLRIKKGLNYFLGCSLFDNNCKQDFEHIGCITSIVCSTKNGFLQILDSKDLNNKKIFDNVYKSFNLSSKAGYIAY